MRQKRIEILKQIDLLESKRCNECTAHSKYNNTLCGCPAAVKVRKLGDELMLLTKPRGGNAAARLDKMKFEDMTVEIYKDIKKTGMSDKDIFMTLKISGTTCVNCKRSVGLIVPRKFKNREMEKV